MAELVSGDASERYPYSTSLGLTESREAVDGMWCGFFRATPVWRYGYNARGWSWLKRLFSWTSIGTAARDFNTLLADPPK